MRRRHFAPLAYGSLRKTPPTQPSSGLLFDRRRWPTFRPALTGCRLARDATRLLRSRSPARQTRRDDGRQAIVAWPLRSLARPVQDEFSAVVREDRWLIIC